MLVGAAILPTAPLLVPGASPTLPEGVARVCDAVDATVDRLPAHDLTVLLAGDTGGGVHTHPSASLAGIGRHDPRNEEVAWSEPGQRVEVMVEEVENEEGMVLLSKEKADRVRIWLNLATAYEQDQAVSGVITGRVALVDPE